MDTREDERFQRLQVSSKKILSILVQIPKGSVCTYGQVAHLAGQANAARQVARLLHACSSRYNLAWHRVLGIDGVLRTEGETLLQQRAMLRAESIPVTELYNKAAKLIYSVDLASYLWNPQNPWT